MITKTKNLLIVVLSNLYARTIQFVLLNCLGLLWSRANSIGLREKLLDCSLLCISSLDPNIFDEQQQDDDDNNNNISSNSVYPVQHCIPYDDNDDDDVTGRRGRGRGAGNDGIWKKIKNFFVWHQIEYMERRSDDDGIARNPPREAIWEMVHALNMEHMADQILALFKRRAYRSLFIFCFRSAIENIRDSDENQYIHLKAYAHSYDLF